ncbi:hypothetical protein [Streptomyces sp. NPDC058758]|uniref:hypothetical protein n=1 Tax=Streptomyces sp. NPDC058758 TaxID=3346627 RepID=UPI0036D0F49B
MTEALYAVRISSQAAKALGRFFRIRPGQGAASGACDRKAEEGDHAEHRRPTTTRRACVPGVASPARSERDGLDTLPEHVEDTVWDVLDAAAADPWGFRQWNEDDPEGEDVRYAFVGQMSLTYWVNRPLRRLTVLNIVWLG